MTDTSSIDMLMDYILKNKEWIFSGIGVFVVSGVVWLCRHLLLSRLPTADGKVGAHYASGTSPVLTQVFVARVREELARRIEISPTQIEITRWERQGLTHFKLFVRTSLELKAFWKSFVFGRDVGYIKESTLGSCRGYLWRGNSSY